MQGTSQHTSILPVFGLLFAATMWGIFWIPLRWLEQQGLQGLLLTLLIYCGTLVYIIPLLALRVRQLGRSPILMLGIIFFSGWCNTSFILALLEGEVVRVILLFYLSPIWSILLARFALKEKISRQSYFVTLLAIIGAMIMLWSPEIGFPWPENSADWLALSSGLAFAATNVLIHKAHDTDITLKMAMSWLGVIVVASLFILFYGIEGQELLPGPSFYAFLTGVILIGPMTAAVVYGVTHLPVHRSAVILLFEIVVSVISTYLLIEERLEMVEWIGGAIVVLSAYFAATHNPVLTESYEQ